ncbi:MAG: response regulator transcription factor [Brevinematia bacterium]
MILLILFYYILSLLTGAVALVFSLFALFKYNNKISRVHFVFQLLLFFFVLNHMVYFYFYNVYPAKFNFVGFMNINYIWLMGLLTYISPALCFLLLEKKFSTILKIFFLSSSIISLFLVILIFLLKLSYNLQEKIIYIYGILLILSVVYIVFILLKNLTACSKFIRELCQKVILILTFFLPGFLIDLNFDLLQNKLRVIPKVFNFLALFYIFWNLLTIYYAYRFIEMLSEKVDVLNIPEKFFEKHSLSEREKEIATLLLQGYTNKEIADRLYISEGTVKNYIYVLFQKLNITNRMQIIKKLTEFLKIKGK